MADRQLTVSPLYYSFGQKLVGSTSNSLITVSNTGDSSDLIIGSLSGASAPFTLTDNSVSGATIAHGDSSTFNVRYAPTAVGALSRTISIPSNDTTYALRVDGTGVEQDISVSPASYNFGTLNVGNTARTTFTVTNVGTATLTMTTVTGAAAPFSKVSDGVSGAVIHPSDSSTVNFSFDPVVPGTFSNTIIFNSDDTGTPAYTVGLYGTCVGGVPIEAGMSRSVVGNEIHDYISGGILTVHQGF